MMKHLLLTLCCLLFLPATARANANTPEPETKKAKTDSWTFNLYFENDLFSGTDGNYTNGVKLTWISPDLTSYATSEKLPEWSGPLIRRIPFINKEGLKRNLAFAIGQSMYTPRDIAESKLIANDRPYGGWTYGSVAFHSKNLRRLDSMEIQAGMVGPLSLTEETQSLVHELRHLQRPNGWDHQIRNEPGLEMIYERKIRLWEAGSPARWGTDVIGHLGAALGNVATYANSGLEVRMGWKVPVDFGTSLIRPAGDSNAPVDSRDVRLSPSQRYGFHLFSLVDGRAVARNIFLDGNSFRPSHSVSKEHLLADTALGAGLLLGNFKITYAHTIRTREFKEQRHSHNFGSITLSFSQ